MPTQVEFIETPAFSRDLETYLDDEQFRAVQSAIATTPEIGDVVPNSGGARKMRWADARRKKGKRGGLRIIYYWYVSAEEIWFLTIFDKNEMSDLSAADRERLKSVVKEIKVARARRRGAVHE